MEEIWKDVKGYEGIYQISNLGNVKSLNYNREHKEKLLKAGIDGWGYKYVALCKDNNRKNKKIHRLVAEHFISNLNKFEQINHINRNKNGQ